MNNDIDSFILQKRGDKQSDEMILQELLSLGWDKTLVLQKLAGSQVPAANFSAASAPQAVPGLTSSQTGGAGTPVQLENVQYNVQVGKVRSKVGFAAFLMSLFAWGVVVVVLMLMLAVRANLIPSAQDVPGDLAGIVVLSIAFLVPLAPIFWYIRKRMHKIIAQNPAATDDLFFKRTIRFHLVISILMAICWIVIMLYNILAKIFLHNQGITLGIIVNSIIFAIVFSGAALFFLQYQNMTKR